MIRVDLGKDQNEKSPKGGSGEVLGKLNSFGSDLRGVIVLAVGMALGFIPHLLVNEFKAYLQKTHEEHIAKIQEKITSVEAEIASFEPFKRELATYEEQKQLVQNRLETVNRFLEARTAPVHALDAVGQSLPMRAWLTGVHFEQTESSVSIKLSGQALANEDISDFVDKLSESIYFSEVKLDEMDSAKVQEADVRVFGITAIPKAGLMVKAAAPTPAAPVAGLSATGNDPARSGAGEKP